MTALLGRVARGSSGGDDGADDGHDATDNGPPSRYRHSQTDNDHEMGESDMEPFWDQDNTDNDGPQDDDDSVVDKRR